MIVDKNALLSVEKHSWKSKVPRRYIIFNFKMKQIMMYEWIKNDNYVMQNAEKNSTKPLISI